MTSLAAQQRSQISLLRMSKFTRILVDTEIIRVIGFDECI